MNRGGFVYYYHPNALWSPEALTDASGGVVERYDYDAYGEVAVYDGSFSPVPLNAWGTPHSAVGNPYLFTGRELDEESGLYFYRARYYDTAKGRFLQRDPLDYLNGLNLYEYVNSQPTLVTDPTGLAPATAATADKPAWIRTRSWTESTVKLGQCCYKIRIDLEYDSRTVQRDGKTYEQWRNLVYPTAQLGAKVPCTGREVGVLANPKQWQMWIPPWASSGETPVSVSQSDVAPTTDAFSQAPPAGGEASASANPQMLGD